MSPGDSVSHSGSAKCLTCLTRSQSGLLLNKGVHTVVVNYKYSSTPSYPSMKAREHSLKTKKTTSWYQGSAPWHPGNDYNSNSEILKFNQAWISAYNIGNALLLKETLAGTLKKILETWKRALVTPH